MQLGVSPSTNGNQRALEGRQGAGEGKINTMCFTLQMRQECINHCPITGPAGKEKKKKKNKGKMENKDVGK